MGQHLGRIHEQAVEKLEHRLDHDVEQSRGQLGQDARGPTVESLHTGDQGEADACPEASDRDDRDHVEARAIEQVRRAEAREAVVVPRLIDVQRHHLHELDDGRAAGAQDAMDLGEHPRLVAHVVDQVGHDHEVRRGVGRIEVLGRAATRIVGDVHEPRVVDEACVVCTAALRGRRRAVE